MHIYVYALIYIYIYIIYKVVEREWVETRTYLLQKIPQDDDVQNNPEHREA